MTDGCFLPAASQQPHRVRGDLALPRETLEADFPKKALAHARLRRQWPQSLHDQISSVLPSHNASAASTRPSHFASTSSSRPSTAPGFDSVESRYMRTSRVHYSRSQTGAFPESFKLFPPRPGTCPAELQPIESAPEIVRQQGEMQIVESPTSLTVDTKKGPQKIPRHQWLVLEPPDLQNTSSFVGRRLIEDFGGGSIEIKGTELLRLVPESRLHAVAAAANFKRASRGTSILSLHHAAFAMELLSQREREVETGAMSVSLQSCLCPSARVDRKRLARLNPVTRVVKDAATAARNRPSIPAEHFFQVEHAVERPRDRLLKGHELLHKGVQCLEEFHKFINRRYGNVVRAWFALDTEENMKIGERTFVRRVLELGFRGNVSAMYRYVDSDRSGSITILEVDSNAAMILAVFKKFIDDNFKGCPDACFHFMDRHRIGRLSRDDVVHSLEKLQFDGKNKDELFDFLDREGFGYVVPQDVAYLKHWKPRAYLFVKPDSNVLKRMKEAFSVIHGSLWRTWRIALDSDCTMRVSWEEFFISCKKLCRQIQSKGMAPPFSPSEESVAAGWRALDFDCSGWIALKEFDVCCYQALKSFKSWAQKEHGGCVMAMRNLDISGNGRLSSWELRKSDTRPTAYPGDVERLFEYLDWERQKSVGEPEVKFLDDWDIAWEEYEESAKGRRKTTLAGQQLIRTPRQSISVIPIIEESVPSQ